MTGRTKHRWIHHGERRVFQTDSATCPPGCVAFTDGTVPSGYAIHVPHSLMDAADPRFAMTDEQRAIARAGIEAATAARAKEAVSSTFDAAGPSKFMDAGALAAALSACPAITRGLQEKVGRAIVDSASSFDSAVDNLRGLAAQYGAHAHMQTAADAKEACLRASQAITETVDGMLVAHTGVVDRAAKETPAEARAAMIDRISNAWQGGAA